MKIYYICKKIIPRWLQIILRRKIVSRQQLKYSEIWPIDEKAGKKPGGFSGWPDKKQFVFILRHDVETAKGQERCYQLADIEKGLGFVSTFNFVPERYSVSDDLLVYLVKNGFEVGIHGLKHDGMLYRTKRIFQKRAIKINQYLEKWKSIGFFSPSSHHNLDWLHELNIKYDSSTFDTDPFEPQPDGVGTIFPIIINSTHDSNGYVEIPYTLPQDFTLFILMKQRDISIWEKKLDWIVKNNGMVFLNTHTDYIKFDGMDVKIDEYPLHLYIDFLKYVKSRYKGLYWHVLPGDFARYWMDTYKNKN